MANGTFKIKMDIDPHGPRLMPNNCKNLKPPYFSLPSTFKDRKSRCRYKNNLPVAHRVFLNYPCQKGYGRKIPARNKRYNRKIPAFWCQKR
jgi:hypothetical protein